MDSLRDVVGECRHYSEQPHSHRHSYGQLVVPAGGPLTIVVAARNFSEGRQSVVYIPPALEHSYYSASADRFFVLDIPPAYLPEAAQAPARYPLDDCWRAIRALLAAEVGGGRTASPRLNDLFRYIRRLLETEIPSASIDYLRRNYHRAVSIEELAALEHYNPSYYCEWFQAKFGISPMGYLRRLRLEAAQELLRDTDYPVRQIAWQVGYQQQAALTRLFRQHTGLSPTQYRAQTRKTGK